MNKNDLLSIVSAAQSNAATMRHKAAMIRKIAAALDGVYITRGIVPRIEGLFPGAMVYYGVLDYSKRERYAVVRFEDSEVSVTLATQDAPRLSRAALEEVAQYYDSKAAQIFGCCATYAADMGALDAVSAYINALQRRVDTVREAARAR
nr:MAG TPA: hypothetical protein [Caudoviricetes sp.]